MTRASETDSWPPNQEEMAYRALKAYDGNKVIYIGEEPPGCTANKAFHDELAQNWTLEKRISLPRWYVMYDSLLIFSRKK